MAPHSPTLVIAGSVRPRRVAVRLSEWIAALGMEATADRFEVVDLRDWPLRDDDEPGMPQTGDYLRPHTIAWSRRVTAAGAIVFVLPQYNGGYPAVVKRAIDHLYREWAGKPTLIVSYGGHGGGRGATQLAEVLSFVKARVLPARPALTLPRAMIEANNGEIDPPVLFRAQADELRAALVALSALRATA